MEKEKMTVHWFFCPSCFQKQRYSLCSDQVKDIFHSANNLITLILIEHLSPVLLGCFTNHYKTKQTKTTKKHFSCHQFNFSLQTHFKKNSIQYVLYSTANHELNSPANWVIHLKTSCPAVPFCIKFLSLCSLGKPQGKKRKLDQVSSIHKTKLSHKTMWVW